MANIEYDPDMSLEDNLLSMLGVCGCGNPDKTLDFYFKVLNLIPVHSNLEKLQALIPDEVLLEVVLNQLDELKITEHGSSIYSSWMTDKGKLVRKKLREYLKK